MKIQLFVLVMAILVMVEKSQGMNPGYVWKRDECYNNCWGNFELCKANSEVISVSDFKVCILSYKHCREDC